MRVNDTLQRFIAINPRLPFIAILVCALSHTIYAKEVDSLRKILLTSNTPDTTKVLVLSGIAREFKNVNADSILRYTDMGMAVAQKINYSRGTALCAQLAGYAYMKNGSYDKAHKHLTVALMYFEEVTDKAQLSETEHIIGLTYYLQTQYQPAIEHFNKSKSAAESINDVYRTARAHFYIGSIHNDMGDFSPSLQDYLSALKLYEQCGDENGKNMSLTNIATLYAQLKNVDKAHEYIARSLKIQPDQNNTQSYFSNISNIAYAYSMLEEDSMSLNIYLRGLHQADSVGDEYWKTIYMTNIAEAYTNMRKFEQALDMYRLVLKRNEKSEDISVIASAHSGMGNILIQQGKKQVGIRYLRAAYDIVMLYNMKRMIMEVAHDLSTVYEDIHDYKNAHEYNKIWYAYRDSIFNETNEKKIQQLQFDYELEKKQRQIEQLSKNREIQKAKGANERIIILSLGVATALLLAIIILMYRHRLAEKERKNEILKKKEEIVKQAAKLDELSRFKDKIFSVLSHDLRGPVSSITTALKMFNKEEISAEEYGLLKPEINRQLDSLNLLLDNVLVWARDNIYDLKAAEPKKCSMFTLAAQNVDMLRETSSRKNITIQNKISKNAIALCDEGQINIVLRNLLMNAIKYTNNGGAVTMTSEVLGNNVLISVTDTGLGIGAHQLDNLFSPTIGRTTYGTEGEKGLGLGLLLCYEFVNVNNGTISVSSELGKGSTFTISLPMA